MSEFTIAVDPRARVALITWSASQPTIGLCRAALDALAAHPDFSPHFGIVSDWRAAQIAPEPRFVEQFLTVLQQCRASARFLGRWATLVRGATAVYGMARMTEHLSEESGVPYRAFVDLDEAVRWVGAE